MIRLTDVIFAASALIVLSPLFVVISIILKLTGEGEILYSQTRVGQNGKKFKVIKFATMLKNSPNMGSGTITSKNDPRILPVGKFLRKTKINELPQIFNVLKGEMSLIGPRPHAEKDLAGIKSEVLTEILNLRPGLSGIGSIVFREEEKILQRFENPRPYYDGVIAPYKADLELWYKRNQSLKLYFALIFLTIFQVAFSRKKLPFEIFTDLPKMPKKLAENY